MKEKDLPIDFTKHKVYSKGAEKSVKKLLRRYYDEKTAGELWEKIQLQYPETESALAGRKYGFNIKSQLL